MSCECEQPEKEYRKATLIEAVGIAVAVPPIMLVLAVTMLIILIGAAIAIPIGCLLGQAKVAK